VIPRRIGKERSSLVNGSVKPKRAGGGSKRGRDQELSRRFPWSTYSSREREKASRFDLRCVFVRVEERERREMRIKRVFRWMKDRKGKSRFNCAKVEGSGEKVVVLVLGCFWPLNNNEITVLYATHPAKISVPVPFSQQRERMAKGFRCEGREGEENEDED
jgi:hypothetical protein